MRSTYRAVPFGMFSAIKLGIFLDEDNLLLLNDSDFQSKAKVNIEISNLWLKEVVKLIESDIELIRDLEIKKTAFVSELNEEYVIFDAYSNPSNEKQTRIKKTKMLQFILEQLKFKKTVSELIIDIKNKFTVVNMDALSSYLLNLIELKLIIVVLFDETARPKDKLDKIIKIKHNKKTSDLKCLEKIYELTYSSNNDFSVTDEHSVNLLIDEIVKLQKKIVKSESYIYLNTYDTHIHYLNYNEKKEIERASNIMYFFTQTTSFKNYIDKYIKYFYEQADSQKEIKVVDLINETHELKSDHSDYIEEDEVFELLYKKILYSLYIKKDVYLKDEDIETIYSLRKEESAFDSVLEFELIWKIRKNNFGNIYIFNPNSIGTQKGAYLARFEHLFEKNASYVTDDFYFQMMSNKAKFVKLKQLPNVKKTADLIESGKNFRNLSYIDFTETNNESIDFSDLYAKVHDEKLYVIDKKDDKVVIPLQINQINAPMIHNRLYNLIYFTRPQFFEVRTDFLSRLVHLNHYTPRIQYKNIVILKKHWIIKYSYLTFFNKNCSFETLRLFLQKINVPMKVMTFGEESLLYNLNNDFHVELLFLNLEKEGEIILTESDCAYGCNYTGDYNSEFVFSLRNDTAKNLISPSLVSLEIDDYPQSNNWITYNIYFSENKQFEVIEKKFPDIFNYIRQSYTKDIFFIKYNDPKPHIRFRVKLYDLDVKVLRLKDYMRKEIQSITNCNISISDFQPEYSRYGGVKMTDSIIDYFIKETSFLLDCYSKKIIKNEENYSFLVIYIYNFLLNCDLKIKEIYEFLYPFKYCTSIKQKEVKKEIKKANYFKESFNIQNAPKLDKQVLLKMDKYDIAYKNQILLSIIHMTINRVKYNSLDYEQNLMKILFEFVREKYYQSKI